MTEPTAPDLTSCECYCHIHPTATCTIDGGHDLGCGPHTTPDGHTDNTLPPGRACLIDHEQPRHGQLLICQRHYRRIHDALAQIVELFALLPDVLEPGTVNNAGGGGARTVYGPAPLRLGVAALTDPRAAAPSELAPHDLPNVPATLRGWVAMTADEHTQPPPDRVDVSTSVAYLRINRHLIARQEWVADYAHEIDVLHRALAHAAGDSMWPTSIGPCPNCGAKLYNTVGVDQVTCRRCEATWAGVHVLRLRLILSKTSVRQ